MEFCIKCENRDEEVFSEMITLQISGSSPPQFSNPLSPVSVEFNQTIVVDLPTITD
jgi:hypothetical protein